MKLNTTIFIALFFYLPLLAGDFEYRQIEIMSDTQEISFSASFSSFDTSENISHDLDIYALLFDKHGYLVDSVSAVKLFSGDGSIKHSGDTFASGTESISIDLFSVHQDVATISLLVTEANGKGFNGLSELSLRLQDATFNGVIDELGEGFHFTESNFSALCFGSLERIDNSNLWHFHRSLEFGFGRDLYSITDEAFRSILRYKDCNLIQKGMTYTLDNPSTIKMKKKRRVYIPLEFSSQIFFVGGWDINQRKVQNPDNVDLDINIHAFRKNMPAKLLQKSQIQTVYYRNKVYKDKSGNPLIELDKDNRSGNDGENFSLAFGKNIFSTTDDEKIMIDLAGLEAEGKYGRLFATITIFNDGAHNRNIGFSCIENPFVRLVDDHGNQIAYYDLKIVGSKNRKKSSNRRTDRRSKRSKNNRKKNRHHNSHEVVTPKFAYLAFEIARDENGWYYELIDKAITGHEGNSAVDLNSKLIKIQMRREQN